MNELRARRTTDRIGQRFERLTVISEADRDVRGRRQWLCACSCGKKVVARGNDLQQGTVKSCGCLRRETAAVAVTKVRAQARRGSTKHGMAGSREFNSWQAMKARCTNPNNPEWKYWGGRGITVCRRWMESFGNFYDDMGDRPAGTTLDRIDNDGNYEPGNCRWATNLEQAHNKRPRIMQHA